MQTIISTRSIGDQDLHTTTMRSSFGLVKRSLINTRRLPSAFLPSLAMPMFNMIAFSGTFFAITKMPGFPTDRSVNWFMPLGLAMGSAFSGVALGFSLIRDLENGFYDRLRMSPTSRLSLVVGPVIATWIRVTLVAAIVFVAAFLLGARPTSGVLSYICSLIAALGIATIGAGWGLGLAYRFQDMRGAAIMQLSIFVTMFLSTAQVPLDVMTGWLHTVARVSPVTNIFRLARAGWVNESSPDYMSWSNVYGGLLAIVILSALSLTFAMRSLQQIDN
ncbi:MAG: ABC transporter permease [Acidimicrobiaceae bacterium]|nr:ABC transporter permease [Acidimicrobiaceae bacterium]